MPTKAGRDRAMESCEAGAGFVLGATAAQRAGYIEELVREMERLAAGPELERLRDLLRLAAREARSRALPAAG